MQMLYRSDKQKCINLNHTNNNNNNNYMSQVYYKLLYADPNANANGIQRNIENDDDLEHDKEEKDEEEDNVYLFMPCKGEKKHLIVYYKPPKKLQLPSVTFCSSTSDYIFNNTSYYLQHFAQNFMYFCFCRSYQNHQHRRQTQQHYYNHHHLHHYTPRRLGTF